MISKVLRKICVVCVCLQQAKENLWRYFTHLSARRTYIHTSAETNTNATVNKNKNKTKIAKANAIHMRVCMQDKKKSFGISTSKFYMKKEDKGV